MKKSDERIDIEEFIDDPLNGMNVNSARWALARIDALETLIVEVTAAVEDLRADVDALDPPCEGRCTARRSTCEAAGQCCGKCTH